MKTVTLVLREGLKNRAMYIDKAFEKPADAFHYAEEMNQIADCLNMQAIWRTFTLVLE